IPFGNGNGGIDHIRFLKCVSAQQVCKDLACNAYHRSGVDQRIGESRDQVCRAWAGGSEYHAGLSGYAGKSLRRVDRSLFMAYAYVIDLINIVVERIVYRHDGPSGITEDSVHTLRHETTQQHFRSGDLLAFSLAGYCASLTFRQ